jgi:hypothetical protein
LHIPEPEEEVERDVAFLHASGSGELLGKVGRGGIASGPVHLI